MTPRPDKTSRNFSRKFPLQINLTLTSVGFRIAVQALRGRQVGGTDLVVSAAAAARRARAQTGQRHRPRHLRGRRAVRALAGHLSTKKDRQCQTIMCRPLTVNYIEGPALPPARKTMIVVSKKAIVRRTLV